MGDIIDTFKSLTTHKYIDGVKNKNWQSFNKFTNKKCCIASLVEDDSKSVHVERSLFTIYSISNTIRYMKNRTEINKLVKNNRSLFWSIGNNQLKSLDDEVIVETILNLGDLKSTKELFEVLGLQHTSEIFFDQVCRMRHNYYPQVVNFFKLYFQRHANIN